MTGTLLALLLLAPGLPREPVGSGEWQRESDPVLRRIGSLMVGEPIGAGGITIVPILARVPSEAGRDQDWIPATWAKGSRAGLIEDGERLYLSLENPGERPLLVRAGTLYVLAGREVYSARDAVLPPRFRALVPAVAPAERPAARPDDGLERQGSVPPLAVGALLLDDARLQRRLFAEWQGLGGDGTCFRALLQGDVERRTRGLSRVCRPLATLLDGTTVGAVFLVGNQPVSAHLFAGHDLFLAALPELLRAVVLQAKHSAQHAGGDGLLAALAQLGDARGRALAFLRSALTLEGEWSESYGAGFDVRYLDPRDGVVAHGVVDHRRRVVHVGLYLLGAWWPDRTRRPTRWTGPLPPRPPDVGGDETAPGEVDRRPRPTLEEARQRARRPGPPDTGQGHNGR